MSFRIQFTISDAEKANLTLEANAEGFPNIHELCKARALQQTTTTYGGLYKKAVKKIEALPAGTKFRLRDLIENPPILIGRWLQNNVEDGTIPNVVYIKKDKRDADAAEYLKL